ncbi:MAG: PhoH family protein [Candidatus Cloacimonetes bacterium]|nr:PhoH family protein [Candidatus Cloacimonadota bacterium]MDD4156755.1 PhoH family protein [Candidatus Cloacimonadota bacterium]
MVELNPFPREKQVKLTKENIANRKIFVLDTNVLIHNPQALFNFQENVVVVPIVVIEEIDNFKKGLDEKGRNARQIGRYLDKLREAGSLKDGIHLESDGYVIVAVSQEIDKMTKQVFFQNINDNLIIGTAVYYQNLFPESKVIMISKDANVRIKSDAIGITAQNYENETIVFEELYTGVKNIVITDDKWNDFTDKKFLPNDNYELYPNQFVRLFKTDDFAGEHLLGRFSEQNDSIYPLTHYKEGMEVFGITARNEEQMFALDLLLDDSIKMVSLVGKAGTGKTLLAIAAGLSQVVEADKYSRLVVSRPISPLGKDIGFLPGSKADKFNPWMQPIYDNMEILLSTREDKDNNNGKIFGKKTPALQDYLDFGFIELEPLTYIRGRSLPNQYIIIDEAQNLTPHEMKTIITRAGEDTKIIITGDPYQIDIPYLDSESNGLSMSAEKLKTEPLIGHITLEKGERSELADIAAKYF